MCSNCHMISSVFGLYCPLWKHWSPQLNCCLCRCLLEPSAFFCWWLVCCVRRCVNASLTAHWRSLVGTWCPSIRPSVPPPTPRHLHYPPRGPPSGLVEQSQVGFLFVNCIFCHVQDAQESESTSSVFTVTLEVSGGASVEFQGFMLQARSMDGNGKIHSNLWKDLVLHCYLIKKRKWNNDLVKTIYVSGCVSPKSGLSTQRKQLKFDACSWLRVLVCIKQSGVAADGPVTGLQLMMHHFAKGIFFGRIISAHDL